MAIEGNSCKVKSNGYTFEDGWYLAEVLADMSTDNNTFRYRIAPGTPTVSQIASTASGSKCLIDLKLQSINTSSIHIVLVVTHPHKTDLSLKLCQNDIQYAC
jgi:hypothetical protein